jgi:hypothetical protein
VLNDRAMAIRIGATPANSGELTMNASMRETETVS